MNQSFAEDSTSANRTSNSIASRKAYAGGRDESDLTVQKLRVITRKEVELDPDHYEPEAREYDASDSESGFGE